MYLSHGTSASIHKGIFLQWVEKLILQTEHLRREFKYIIVTMHDLGSLVCYQALARLAEHKIIAYAFTGHTSHRTMVLDYSVFSSLKEYLRKQWSIRLPKTGVLCNR